MIEEIINQKAIEIYFQPIVAVKTKSVYAFESLTRCNFRGFSIPPNELFAMAREKNLSIQLDEMSREISIKKFKTYYEMDNNLILFLNVEPELINCFDENQPLASFVHVIQSAHIPFKNFVLEIKEDRVKNIQNLCAFCTAYKRLGFHIALDDFGTGNSNFHRINSIKPDIIKIDKSLFTQSNKLINKEIVTAISNMAHNLGIRVLAEGVETQESICLGMHTNINLFQGYFFSHAKENIDVATFVEIESKCNEIGKNFKKNNS